jgi:hypothetical protein
MKAFPFRKQCEVQIPQSKLNKVRIWLSRILKLGFLIWLCSNFVVLLIVVLIIGIAWYIIYPLVKARRTTTER